LARVNRLRAAVNRLVQLTKLNARVAALALRGRWLRAAHVASGYDRAAPTYNDAWQRHLRPVTDQLLDRMPLVKGAALDLGCGTGYASRRLGMMNPSAAIVGADISKEMLAVARRDAPANVRFVQADMLGYARRAETSSLEMVVSTWALGYSDYRKLFREVARAMGRGGTFGFIVNYADTLRPVFGAFGKCMVEFPERVRLAAWPRFPLDWDALRIELVRQNLKIIEHEDGNRKIQPPQTDTLAWLRQTGILSGFDQMLDLEGGAGERFGELVEGGKDDIHHHYALVVARKE
jgi:SAM-dependent methyltransferase